MNRWLFKEEPSHYSYADLERDGETVWEGVANPLAQKHLRSVRRGDLILYYHTGAEKAVVGIMEAAANPQPDPADPSGQRVVLRVRPRRRLPLAVPLTLIKAEPLFAGWELVRMPRLSVMPVPEPLWRRIEELAGLSPDASDARRGGSVQ